MLAGSRAHGRERRLTRLCAVLLMPMLRRRMSLGLRVSVVLGAALSAIGNARGQAEEPESAVDLLAEQCAVERLAPGLLSTEAVFVVGDVSSIRLHIRATRDDITTSVTVPGAIEINETNVSSYGGCLGSQFKWNLSTALCERLRGPLRCGLQ